ncbi:NAD-dependent epimerase/dehydratase family protein [Piscinibacter defluvii]|uniref:NAD-dependent epimerase/dehydratase family protein n=1 Tax=Piscinibacter defluvii TaxID=1796922 RepID=UPI000FDDFEFB|nr:NAD(P)-dependent oxidoreductase [Piscinibacter defluvii]
MHAIVTGGLGFIGSHTVEALLGAGWDVTIVDNLSSNVVDHHHFRNDARIVRSTVQAAFAGLRTADLVIHLASIVGPLRVAQYSGDIEAEILQDTRTVLDYCLKFGVRLLFGSSSDVYACAGWLREEDEIRSWGTTTPRAAYASGKHKSEQLIAQHCTKAGLPYTCVRFFNVAGPRQSGKGGFVIPRFIASALHGTPLQVHGSGRQLRTFLHSREAATALKLLAEATTPPPILNIGNPKNVLRIIDLARLVVHILRSSSPIVSVDPAVCYGARFDDGFEKLPRIDLAIEALRWLPALTVEDIILDAAEAMSIGIGASNAS